MVKTGGIEIGRSTKLFTIRKLSRSGNSRSMSVGTILPFDWVAVKVIVEDRGEDVVILRLERIK